MPDLRATDGTRLVVHEPQGAKIPMGKITDDTKDLRYCVSEGLRLGKHPGHIVLHGRPLFRPFPYRDISHERAERIGSPLSQGR